MHGGMLRKTRAMIAVTGGCMTTRGVRMIKHKYAARQHHDDRCQGEDDTACGKKVIHPQPGQTFPAPDGLNPPFRPVEQSVRILRNSAHTHCQNHKPFHCRKLKQESRLRSAGI